jgi:hypothetical protein
MSKRQGFLPRIAASGTFGWNEPPGNWLRAAFIFNTKGT